MKRLFTLGVTTLLLAACAGTNETHTYKLDIRPNELVDRAALAEAARSVTERQLLGLQIEDPQVSLRKEGDEMLVDVSVDDAEVYPVLDALLQDPFRLEIMRAVDTGTGDVVVEGMGAFERTGIDASDMRAVESGASPSTGFGYVKLHFTDEGRQKIEELFAASVGKTVGIFVNERLVSAMQVESGELEETILINGIPDPIMAVIFADDVNVGLHVTFTPVP